MHDAARLQENFLELLTFLFLQNLPGKNYYKITFNPLTTFQGAIIRYNSLRKRMKSPNIFLENHPKLAKGLIVRQ